MSIDAFIYVKLKPNSLITYIDYFLTPVNYTNMDATHEVNILERYYGKDGGKGYWPNIYKTLCECFKEPDVLKVFYMPDTCHPLDDVPHSIQPITEKEVADICLKYIQEKDKKC
jgi:hypothetical protein